MSFSLTISDIMVMVKRNLLRYRRMPQLIVFSFIQPIMFLIIFVYVFGGAIRTTTPNYISYLLPGIIVQTVLFGAMQSGVGLADDLSKGMIDRFRSLPMARSAVLAGRTISESIRNVVIILIMVIAGFIMGFRIDHGVINFIFAMIFPILFGFAFSWISATIGLAVKNVETAQTAGFIWVFPLVFISSVFVPLSTMPEGLRGFAEHSPITYTVNVVRDISLGIDVGNDIWFSLAWIAAILLVFIPFAVNRYKKIV